MKQHKNVNVNVKVRLTRIPSKKEKLKLVELVANVLDERYFYDIDLSENQDNTLEVENHYVTERKMGKL